MCPPLYEYTCPQGHTEERLEPLTAPEAHPCPECGDEARRQATAWGGFVMEGKS